jgi:phospho-N-acetylmuramoyl-pentapeptide-transferase
VYPLLAITFLLALGTVLAAGGPVIRFLRSKKSVQPISPDAPEKHRLKHGTPSMGGVLIVLGILVALLPSIFGLVGFSAALNFGRNVNLMALVGTLLGGCAIGLLDDLGKVRKKENKAGLSEKAKLALQFLVAGVFIAFLWLTQTESTTRIYLGSFSFSLGYTYYALAFLYLLGFANAVNFTDGVDGLSSSTTLIVALTLCFLASSLNNTSGVAFFYVALAGACAGFLCFNAFPARIFMGDTGSLAIGMALPAAAILAKQEILLMVVGSVYIIEILSMMIQRYVFKYRRIKHGLEYAQKNRVFKRAPLHHHFEEMGWHEVQVVQRFCGFVLFMAALAILWQGGAR